MVLFPFKKFIRNAYSEKTAEISNNFCIYEGQANTERERDRREREREKLSTSLLPNSHNGQD